MSYVLEGIIVPVAESAAANEVAACDAPFEVLPLNGEISILARPGRPAFNEAVCEFAGKLSTALGVALVVRWDDRVGARESRVFRNGSQTHRFDNENELYVKLDDRGLPLREGRKYQESELDALDDDEFEVFQNALELGCVRSEFCPWQLLHDFIRRQG
jgi:hypothetical protein